MVVQIANLTRLWDFYLFSKGETGSSLGSATENAASIDMTRSGPCSSVGRARPW